MPTAAKLVAAFALAFAAYGVAGVAEFRSPDLRATGVNPMWIAFVAGLVGWSQLGAAAPKGYQQAVGSGIASAFVAFGFVVVCAAALHIVDAVQYHAYKDVDAMLDGFIKKLMQFSFHLGDWAVLAAVFFGGALAGVFSGFAGRLWT